VASRRALLVKADFITAENFYCMSRVFGGTRTVHLHDPCPGPAIVANRDVSEQVILRVVRVDAIPVHTSQISISHIAETLAPTRCQFRRLWDRSA
jgi:hypothetical protein